MTLVTDGPSAVSKSHTPLSLSESDGDEEFFTNKRSKLSKKQRRHLKEVAEGLAPPTQAHQRFSTRRRITVANYNETSDNEFDDEDILTPNYWVNAPEEDSPFIGQVLAHEIFDDHSAFFCLFNF
jgi:chromodomain-helicase-DNA-binding protein 1